MNSFNAYPSIFAFGHRAIQQLLDVPVNVEEKVDGSQFSFGIDSDGQDHIRSKGVVMVPGAPEKMFSKAWETVVQLRSSLHPDWTYRAEYLRTPKHNVLAYNRVPKGHLIIFDIATDHETYLDYEAKLVECERIGLECVPLLYSGMVENVAQFRTFLERESVLGGQKIEGVVVKPIGYNLFGTDKKPLLGKFVSEAYKEIHSAEWKSANPSSGDIIAELVSSLRTPARWNKAVQHLQESGRLERSPRDIGNLIREVQLDTKKEAEDFVKDRLFKFAWKHIERQITHGLPEWYKDELLKMQFEKE